MQINRICKLIIILNFILVNYIQAQEVLTLDESLSIAYKDNVRMISARKEIDAVKGRSIQEKAYSNPEIEFESYSLPGSFKLGSGETEIGSSQEIEIMGKRKARKNVAQVLLGFVKILKGIILNNNVMPFKRNITYWKEVIV